MTDDLKRQRDIQRRLGNLANAPRCGAKTRAGGTCKQAAIKGRSRCRMHGGARGSGGPTGERNGNFRHGYFTAESVDERKAARELVRQTRKVLGPVR
jgi:glucans biosynthesis protein